MKRWFTLLFSFLLLPMLVQAGTVGKLRGTITDLGTGEPLIGANVIIVGTSFGAATNIDGQYTILNLEAGTYDVKASYIGYQTITVSNVRINADLTTALNFELPAEGVTVAEVVVLSEKPLINPSNTNAIRNLTNDDFEKLPLRGINQLLAFAPGVVLQDNQIYVRGGRLDEVGYYLEGTNITNPLQGGRQVTLSQDAIEEIQVQSGGYTAEFGGANSGIIRQQLKTGSNNIKASLEYITDNLSFQGSGDRFNGDKVLGAHWFGYSELVATLSGPLFTNKVKFFGLFSSNFQNDVNAQPFPGINLGWINDPNSPIPGDSINFNYPAGPTFKNSAQTYIGTGTLTFDFNPLIFRLSGTYSDLATFDGTNFFSTQSGNAGKLNSIINLDRVQQIDQTDGSFNLKMTHILSPTTFYELSGGFAFNDDHRYDPFLVDDFIGYGDSVANAGVGQIWERRGTEQGRYVQPANYQIFNFSFFAPGAVTSGYRLRKQEALNFSAALSTQLGDDHSIKIGGELQTFTIRNYSFSNRGLVPIAGILAQNEILPAGDPTKLSPTEIFINQGVNNYGYDVFGKEYDGTDDYTTGSLAPKQPTFIGAYIQDQIEYKNLIVNIGFRYDYIDTDNKALIDAEKPEQTISFNTGVVDPAGLVEVPTFSSVSPRFGFSFPITDQTVFHAQYGKFVQQTRLRDIYQGIYATSNQLRGGFFIANPVGFNVRPTRTTQYEVGFTQQVGEFASFYITGYYKDIQDQIVISLQSTGGNSPYQSYNIFTNGDFATTKGVEISFNMRRVSRVMVNGSVSFQDARGTGSFPNSSAGIVGAPVDGKTIFKPTYVSPLVFNQAFSGNLSFDYRFGVGEGGPILQQLGLNALLNFNSGHPFTRGKGKGNTAGALEGDSRFREPIEPLNASTTPGTFQVDLRLDKTFSLFDELSANIYIYVINLFDITNVESVFLRTGAADDDGFLSNFDLGGQLAEQNGPDYVALYNALNIDYYQAYQNAGGITQGFGSALIYGPPRQIRFGVRLEY